MENKPRKLTGILAVSLAAALLVGGGTSAYLYSNTEDDIVNGFNPNQVKVEISETGNGQYQIIPGTSQTKDPTVTVNASVDSYVYLYVTDTTQGLVEYEVDTSIWKEIDNSGGEWDYILEDKNYDPETTKIYYTTANVAEMGTAENFTYGVLVGDTVSYNSSLENDDMVDEDGNLLEGLNLTFSAEAVQTADFEDYEEAFDAMHGGINAIKKAQSDYTWTISLNENEEDTASITGYKGSDTELTIPSKVYVEDNDGNYNLYTVTGIAKQAFYKNTSITSVTIPEGLQEIGLYTFGSCTNLKSITIPSSLKTITECAFYGCTNLENVNLSKGVENIGKYAFNGCTSLKSITIPSSLTTITGYAFYKCTNLESINLPEALESIGEYAFYNCENLKSITIPSSVTSIERYTFSGCSSLETVNLPENFESIGEGSFYGCTSLISIEIPDTVTNIDGYIFYGCTKLESITLPSTISEIKTSTFYGCTALTNITIPNSVTTIGLSAFRKCTGLESIIIPSSVTTINMYAFESCSALSNVYYTGTQTEWKNITIKSYNSPLTNATTTKHYEYNA